MTEPLVYISLTNGKDRLVIDGSFGLFKNFMDTFTQGDNVKPVVTICNPAPQASEITAQARHD